MIAKLGFLWLGIIASAIAHTTGDEGGVFDSIEGTGVLEQEIAQTQAMAKEIKRHGAAYEKLGWLFVSKARQSGDHTHYARALQCANTLEKWPKHALDAKLLRAHIYHQEHRFAVAEKLARELTEKRELAYDFGLFGDALFERGKVREAARAYQTMMDLKPGAQAYARAAQIFWIQGKTSAALDAMQRAIRASSARDPEPLAWHYHQLGKFQWHLGQSIQALQSLDRSLALVKGYPPSLSTQAMIYVGQGDVARAKAILDQRPLDQLQTMDLWMLWECEIALGNDKRAERIERSLFESGTHHDPRTTALFAATQERHAALALRLARAELKARADVFTHDALAWALAKNGHWQEAWKHAEKALSEGIIDARISLHAAIIAQNLGHSERAADLFSTARCGAHTLYPSEQILTNVPHHQKPTKP